MTNDGASLAALSLSLSLIASLRKQNFLTVDEARSIVSKARTNIREAYDKGSDEQQRAAMLAETILNMASTEI